MAVFLFIGIFANVSGRTRCSYFWNKTKEDPVSLRLSISAAQGALDASYPQF